VKNIVLVGFMGTGKSAVSAEIAHLRGMECIESDEEVVRRAGMSIPEIFAAHGEAYFRDLESEVLRELSGRREVVISTGGGAVLRDGNVAALRSGGLVVCLDAGAEEIYARTRTCTNRPLLQVEDPLGRIRELLAARRPHYERACVEPGFFIATEGRTPREVAGEILTRLPW
jgi:shikimate kinase